MTHHNTDQSPDPSSTCTPAPQRIHGRAELITALPYLLGFHPNASLVLAGLDGGRLIVTARVDLVTRSADNGAALGEPDMPIAETMSAMARGGSRQVIAVAYPDTEPPSSNTGPGSAVPGQWGLAGHRDLPATQLLAACASDVGLELLDYLQVQQGRWCSLTCRDTADSPCDGAALPATPSVFQTQATVSGLAPAANRAHLHRRFAPTGDLDDVADTIAEIQVELGDPADGDPDAPVPVNDVTAVRTLITACRAAAGRHEADPTFGGAMTVTDGDVAFFGVLLRRVAVRDAIWLAVDDGRLPDPAFWLELARRLPAPYNAGPLFLYGWHAWRQGNGAVARIAADRALAADPSYSAAQLLTTALDAGVNPLTMPILSLPA